MVKYIRPDTGPSSIQSEVWIGPHLTNARPVRLVPHPCQIRDNGIIRHRTSTRYFRIERPGPRRRGRGERRDQLELKFPFARVHRGLNTSCDLAHFILEVVLESPRYAWGSLVGNSYLRFSRIPHKGV
jgi:hypothetical protein